jgi:hypothetical protein
VFGKKGREGKGSRFQNPYIEKSFIRKFKSTSYAHLLPEKKPFRKKLRAKFNAIAEKKRSYLGSFKSLS